MVERINGCPEAFWYVFTIVNIYMYALRPTLFIPCVTQAYWY